MQNSYYFACGTPSDREGFTYTCLNDDSLPGSPASYLDRVTEIGPEGVFAVDFISVDTQSFALFTEYRAIQPSDRDYNRGAYIAAGFLSPPEVGIHDLANSIALTKEVIGALVSKLDAKGAFPKDFKLEEFTHPIPRSYRENLSPYFLADLVFQASNRQGSFSSQSGRIVLNPSDPNLNSELESLSFYNRPKNDRLVEEFRAEARSAKHSARVAAERLAEADKELGLQSTIVREMQSDLESYKAERDRLDNAKLTNDAKGTDLGERLNSYLAIPETEAPLSYDRSISVEKPATAHPRPSKVDRTVVPVTNTRQPAHSGKIPSTAKSKSQRSKVTSASHRSPRNRPGGDWTQRVFVAAIVLSVLLGGYLAFDHFFQPETKSSEERVGSEIPKPYSEGNQESEDTAKGQDTDFAKERMSISEKR